MPTMADLLTPEALQRLRSAPVATPQPVLAKPVLAKPVLAKPVKSVKPVKPEKKKVRMPVANLETMSSAELGETIKRAERERIAASLPKKRKKAKDKTAAIEKANDKARKAARASLTAMGVLPGFTLGRIEVPALDVADLPSLQETPDAKMRSPYNKALSSLKEPTLPYRDDPGIGVTAVTWADLVTLHQRLSTLATQEPVKVKGAKAQFSAPIDLDEKIKIAALRKALGCSKKEARVILASV